MKFTSVRGHIFDYELPPECKTWATFDNKKILMSEVPMIKKLGPGMEDVVKNLEQLAKKSTELVLWLDCDR
jgi:DNA topoisomerase IA